MPRFIRTIVVLALTLTTLHLTSPKAYAVPPDATTIYYEGCGDSKEEVGWRHQEGCSGYVTQDGQQSGDWRVLSITPCIGGTPQVHYYQWCGGTWVLVSQSHFETECNCA
jgi:hypothetical protein